MALIPLIDPITPITLVTLINLQSHSLNTLGLTLGASSNFKKWSATPHPQTPPPHISPPHTSPSRCSSVFSPLFTLEAQFYQPFCFLNDHDPISPP